MVPFIGVLQAQGAIGSKASIVAAADRARFHKWFNASVKPYSQFALAQFNGVLGKLKKKANLS